MEKVIIIIFLTKEIFLQIPVLILKMFVVGAYIMPCGSGFNLFAYYN